jgi:SSS family solute:Na+ symporter
MNPYLILFIIAAYFGLLLIISHFTSKGANNDSFFVGNKQSPWYIVAFGMIGASLSGVTFISVPGWVGSSQFSYMQMVLGYLVGYFVIATILMPLYYRLNLTSIYAYLGQRFGPSSLKTGASYFLLSRMIGAAFRLYLVAIVFELIFDKLEIEIPFVVTVIITIGLIWLYTFKAGIKTIIWTDTLQTLFMLIAVGLTIYLIAQEMNLNYTGLVALVQESDFSRVWFFDNWNDPRHFGKQFISGAFIAIVMTGLDQDMMQKNLSCKNLKEAQTNMFSFSIVLVFVNLLFLTLGALLFLFSSAKGIAIPEKTDYLYPMIALDGHLGLAVGILFILGLIASAYSSADSALTALTTSFSVDILEIQKKPKEVQERTRKLVHVGVSLVMVVVIVVFKAINDDSVIQNVFTVAGYTYGPLLGLYAFGLFTQRSVADKWVPIVCLLSPVLAYILNSNSEAWFNGFKFGFFILIVNGLITFTGLWILSLPTFTSKKAAAKMR